MSVQWGDAGWRAAAAPQRVRRSVLAVVAVAVVVLVTLVVLVAGAAGGASAVVRAPATSPTNPRAQVDGDRPVHHDAVY